MIVQPSDGLIELSSDRHQVAQLTVVGSTAAAELKRWPVISVYVMSWRFSDFCMNSYHKILLAETVNQHPRLFQFILCF